jgi:hypothetical protein
MKKLLTILLLTNLHAYSQGEIAIAAGGSKLSGIINMQVGYSHNHHIYYNQIANLTNGVNVPDILGLRYGYLIKGFEPSVGLDYHLLSTLPSNDKARGWKFAYGLAYKIKKFFIGVGATGNVFYGTAGIYKAL